MSATQSPITTVLAAMAALAVAAFLTVNLSMAAFTDDTASAQSNWDAGVVSISNDHTGTAAFDAGNIVPGYSSSSVIQVTNSSSVNTDVVLYAAVAGDLAGYLTVTVEKDGVQVYDGLLSAMPATYAAGTAASEAPGAVSDWQFLVSLPSTVGNDAAGTSASATFTWEARSQ